MGWWVGRGSGDPCGHLLRITPDFSRFVGQVYTPRDLAEILPVSRRHNLTQTKKLQTVLRSMLRCRELCSSSVLCSGPAAAARAAAAAAACWRWHACAAAALSLALTCTSRLPPQSTKSQSESEDMRARMLAALKQKQQELAGGVAFNPVSEDAASAFDGGRVGCRVLHCSGSSRAGWRCCLGMMGQLLLGGLFASRRAGTLGGHLAPPPRAQRA